MFGRDGLLAMMERTRAGGVDVVVVEALDRLSRDMEDLAGIHKRLAYAGIELRAVHDGRADTVTVGLRGLVAQLYREDGAKKVKRGMAGVIRDGRHAGGRAYGYRPIAGKPGEMEIIPDEADIVRRIFAAYAAGATPRDIAGALNQDAVAPPRGAKWNAATIKGPASAPMAFCKTSSMPEKSSGTASGW
ncbi:recombinase family protein [Methylocapsa aurea]|uniref:recombinase family protein n=1 Tax=Methylocapsa aurea TaxID=663610 RepID=UPI00315B0035